MKRVLSLLLVFALLLPNLTVFAAAETITNEAEMAGTISVTAFKKALQSAIDAGPDKNGYYSYDLRKDLTVDSALTLDLPENFVLYVNNAALTVNEDASFTMNSGSLECNASPVTVFGSMTIGNGANVFLHQGTEMAVLGKLEHHGNLHVGYWMSEDSNGSEGMAGRLVISPNAIWDNYGYVNISKSGTLVDEKGNVYGKSGGYVHMNGTLNTRQDDNGTSFFEIGGNMDVNNGSKIVCHDEGMTSMLEVLATGSLMVAERADVSKLSDGYVAAAIGQAQVSGLQKIKISALYNVDKNADLFDLLCTTNSPYYATLIIAHGSRTLNESVATHPASRISLAVMDKLTIPAGVSLTMNGGQANIAGELVINRDTKGEEHGSLWLNNGAAMGVGGTLTNNGYLHIGIFKEANIDSFAGHLSIREGGKLNTTGYVCIHPVTETSGGDILLMGDLSVTKTGFVDNSGQIEITSSGKITTNVSDGGVGVITNPVGTLHNDGKCTGDIFWAMGEVKITNRSSDGAIKVSWDEVRDAKSYQVYRATSKKGTYKLMKTTTGTSYTNTTATAGKTYYYKVRAVLADDSVEKYSDWSDIKSRTRDLAQPSITLSGVSSSGKIKVSWKAIDGAEKYEVYRATSKNGKYTKMTTTSKTSYTNTSAKAGTTYYYKVKAIHENSAANSAYSSYKSRTCDLPRPDVEISLKSGDPRLTWDKVSGAKEYKIYRATSKNGTYKWVKTTTGTSYTNTAVTAGKTYYYKVMAVHSKSAANSAYSSVVSIKAK